MVISDGDNRLPTCRYVTLQALNDRERDEWMLTVHNLGKDGGYIKDEKVVPPSLLSGVGQFFVSLQVCGRKHCAHISIYCDVGKTKILIISEISVLLSRDAV